MSETVESLLALLFGDLEVLASGVLLRDADAELSLRDLEASVIVEVLTGRFPDAARPALKWEIERIVAQCKGDPLVLLRQASETVRPSALGASRFPLALFAEENPAAALPPLGFDVADSHLHSGASVPLPLFFRGLATRARAFSASDSLPPFVSASGRAWDLVGVMAAVRWCTRVLWFKANGNDLTNLSERQRLNLSDDLIISVAAGSFWTEVARLLRDGPRSDIQLFAAMARRFPDIGRSPPIAEMMWRFADDTVEISAPARRAFLVGLTRAMVALAWRVIARPGEGLSGFVDRFEAMGLLRDAALDDVKAEAVQWTLKQTGRTFDVVGAEFRKTIVATTRSEYRQKIVAALGYHYRAFAEFVKDEGRAQALAMPISFKRLSLDVGHSRLRWLDELRACIAACEALRIIIAEYGETAREAISSTDVAGDEIGSANWPYCIAAQVMRATGVNLRFTIHAGESFSTPLNGIRRIGELFTGQVKPGRIGHALALSAAVTPNVCSGDRFPLFRADAVLDLAWISRCNLNCRDEAEHFLDRVVTPVIGRRRIGVDNWLTGAAALYDLDSIVSAGIAYVQGGTFGVSTDDDLVALCAAADEPHRATLGLAIGAGPLVVGCSLQDEVDTVLRRDLDRFGERVRDELEEFVVEEIRANGTVIEACPTSNTILARIATYGAHPLWRWHDNDLKISVSTDDPLMFGSSIVDEFRTLLDVGPRRIVEALASTSVASCAAGQRRDAAWLGETARAFT